MGATEIQALALDTSTVLAMGLVVVTAYGAIWAVRRVIALAQA